jgi:heptaprenyl diphosphate synthase
MKKRINTYNITFCGIFTALAMIFSYIESLIPIPLPIPGIKLGIANIAIITVLYAVGSVQAVAINLLRITLTAILFGNLNSFLFSLAGGMLSILVMVVLKRLKVFSMVGVSIAGGVAHNIGQVTAAVFIMDTAAIYCYLPVLLVAGVVTGIVIGIVGGLATQRVMPARKCE